MKIGDKLVCNNGQTYTLGKGDRYFEFSLLNELNEEVNLYHDSALEDCMPWNGENTCLLCVGFSEFNGCTYAEVIEFIES